jgi:hypothetical protein
MRRRRDTMKEYFDLNERTYKAWKRKAMIPVKLKGLPGVFSESRYHLPWDPPIVGNEEPVHIPIAHQLFMYLGAFIGVLLSTAVSHFRSGNVDLTITVGEVLVSAAIALVIIPLVYEKLSLNPRAPLIVQFGLFVQNGVFWHVLIDSIGSIL